MLGAKITLLGRMSNAPKFGTLLTKACWLMLLHIKEQKQLTTQVKPLSDILFCIHISNMRKIIFIINPFYLKNKLTKKQQQQNKH